MSWASITRLNLDQAEDAAMIETAKSTRRAGVSLYESPRNTTLARKRKRFNLLRLAGQILLPREHPVGMSGIPLEQPPQLAFRDAPR